MADMIHCQLLSPEGAVFDGQVSFVGPHALDGRVAILRLLGALEVLA